MQLFGKHHRGWKRISLEACLWAMLFAAALLLSRSEAFSKTVDGSWRIAIKPAAAVSGELVTLGEIASPRGQFNEQTWLRLAQTPLWPAPDSDRPMSVNRSKLESALNHYLGDMAALCVLPSTLTLKRGGKVIGQDQLAQLIVKSLTPQAASLPGEISFRDYRTPEYIFMESAGNTLKVEIINDVKAGRVGVRIRETDPAGQTVKSYSGSVFLDQWMTVAAASRPLNRGDALTPEMVTHVRKNMAHLRSSLWDGRGGPWRVRRPIGAEQPIEMSDIEPLPVISKGDTVTLVYQGDYIRLETPAEALDDAGMGEVVAVRNLQSKREVFGKVHDGDTVYVQ